MNVGFSASPPIDGERLNALFSAAWPRHEPRDFAPVLAQSLAYICAFHADRLIGFVNLAWDGGAHAFVLDPTVHPDFRRRGIGTELVSRAASLAQERGVEWLHVDHEPELGEFYRRCGFQPTAGGIRKLPRPGC
jgi:GNAT superfamily N-acetyltransferase